MRRVMPLKSKLRSDANQLNLSFVTSKPMVTRFGMDAAQFTKKEAPERQSTDSEKKPEKQYQHLCLSERNTISKRIKQGWCLSAIARELDRGKQTIAAEVSKNGGRNVYDPIVAHDAAMKRKSERDMKCSLANKEKKSRTDERLIERIENLEMQLEIFSETLKELTRERNKTNYRL